MSEETKKNPLKVYIGWDSREDIAYQVARQSILDHASVPVEIIPIKQRNLRKAGLYWREVDKLASTEFTFTRFLIPELNEFNGWALFIDCDFVFLDDVAKIFAKADDKYGVMCAHHDYTPKEGMKMDGKEQRQYPRKNWSSMMLINCSHPKNRQLDRQLVNNDAITGAYLHRFSWLDDSEIGELSHEWNWLVGWYKEPEDGHPRALHYTEGGPWFEEYRNCEYAAEWERVRLRSAEKAVTNLSAKLSKKNSYVPDIKDLPLADQKKNLITDLLNYIVDPNEFYYKGAKERFDKGLLEAMGNKVAAIDSLDEDGGIDYRKKDLDYDQFLQSFILGSGGYCSDFDREIKSDSALVIRGVGGSSQKAIKHCLDNGRTFYTIDTGYLGNGKSKTWHRITKNALQWSGPIIERPADRLSKLNYQFKPFTEGRKILICPPSNKVMNLFNQPDPETWTNQVVEKLKTLTDRPIEIRLKPSRAERVTNNTIEQALADDVYCLVTYNSIAATEALLNGKPAIALGPNAATSICNKNLEDIDYLNRPSRDEMIAFASHLAYCQFTQQEMQNGTAWRIVNESH